MMVAGPGWRQVIWGAILTPSNQRLFAQEMGTTCKGRVINHSYNILSFA